MPSTNKPEHLNILIYLPDVTQHWGGIRQYCIALLKMLQGVKNHRYYIFHDLSDPEILQHIIDQPNFTLVKSKDIFTEEKIKMRVPIHRLNGIPILGKIKFVRRLPVPNSLQVFCERNEIKVIHCPYQYLPKVEGVKLITTMHDVQEIYFPEFFTAEERAARAVYYLDYLRRADTVVVSYNHIKSDLVKYFNVQPDHIEVLLVQMNKLWFERFTTEDVVELPENLSSAKFFLYPANPWKHKNHIRLLESVAKLRDVYKVKVNLVFTGDFSSENGKDIVQKITELMLDDQIKVLGIVNETVLFSLYKRAFAAIVPTLYEAGSFPLMESILLGVPVICSTTTSLPDTIGDERFLFDPNNVDSIVSKMKEMWGDDHFRKENIERIKLQANKIKSHNSLPILEKIYNSFQV